MLAIVLVYLVQHDQAGAEPAEQCADLERALADPLGRTRAAVLRTISTGACSTSELAARAGIPLAATPASCTAPVSSPRVAPATPYGTPSARSAPTSSLVRTAD
jgi:hypothetical protein